LQGEDAVKHASGVGAGLLGLDRLDHLSDPALGEEIDWSAVSKMGVESVEPLERGLSLQGVQKATQYKLDAFDLPPILGVWFLVLEPPAHPGGTYANQPGEFRLPTDISAYGPYLLPYGNWHGSTPLDGFSIPQ